MDKDEIIISIDCSICLISLNNEFIKLPCNHKFHDSCIKEWNKKNNTCPLCRSIVIPINIEINRMNEMNIDVYSNNLCKLCSFIFCILILFIPIILIFALVR